MGGGVLAYAMMAGLLTKEKKMTKLEKACLDFALALTERAQELQKKLDEVVKRRDDLELELANAERLLAEEKRRADDAEAKVAEASKRVSVIEEKLLDLEGRLDEVGRRPTRRGSAR